MNANSLVLEALRRHYTSTLRHWMHRRVATWQAALAHLSEVTSRKWRLYSPASALQFEHGTIGACQILAANRTDGLSALPLTRRELYQ